VVTVRPGQVISIDTVDGNSADSRDNDNSNPGDSRKEQDTAITILRLPGQIVEFHQPMGAAVQWLIEQQMTKVSQLPHLNAEQKIALIDKLCRQNIVTVD